MVRVDVPVDHPAFGKLYRCPNYRVEHDEDRRRKLMQMSNLDVFADKTFENFYVEGDRWNDQQMQSLKFAREAARRYALQPRGWLLLEGPYGCGKTHLAAAIGHVRLAAGDSVLFITSPDLLDYLRSTYNPGSELAYDEMFDRVRNAGLLLIDDLGTENPSRWAQEKLFQLLNHRYTRYLPTVITTNADIDLLDPRLRSRLLDADVVHRYIIAAPDYRSSNLNKQDQLSILSMYRDKIFDTFDTHTKLTADEARHLESIRAIALRYAYERTGWLVLTGAYGSGKTHLAAAIANEWQRQDQNVLFVSVPELLDNLRMSFGPGAVLSFGDTLHAIKTADSLVLDDLGTENATAWAKEKLFQIVNYRYVARLPTVITTSKALEDIDERIRSRLFDDRLCAIYVIPVEAWAFRMKRAATGWR